jgi:hypothetical protein
MKSVNCFTARPLIQLMFPAGVLKEQVHERMGPWRSNWKCRNHHCSWLPAGECHRFAMKVTQQTLDTSGKFASHP